MFDVRSLLSLPRRAALVGLAAALAALGTADTASAQRGPAGDVWDATSRSAPRPVAQETLGRPGRPGFERSGRIDHQVPRGYAGGHYETRYEQVWVPPTTRQEWCPARYGYRTLPCGTRVRYLIEPGHYHTVCVPGRYEQRAVQVWVPAPRTHRVSHVGRPRYR